MRVGLLAKQLLLKYSLDIHFSGVKRPLQIALSISPDVCMSLVGTFDYAVPYYACFMIIVRYILIYSMLTKFHACNR